MMDPTRERRSHQSKFVNQLCYYIIVVILQIRLELQYFLKYILIFILSV